MNNLIGVGQLIFLGGFCLALYRLANGKLEKKVDRDTCHAHIDGLKEEITRQREVDLRIEKKLDKVIAKNGWD